MRKVAGVLLAAAMVLPIALVASPAGAAGGTTCKTTTATATFSPALPILGSKTKVNTTVTSTGTISGCVGGGVTGGSFKTSYKLTGENCSVLLAYTGKKTTAPITTTWSNHQTSTGTITLIPIKGSPTKNNVTGVTTKGLFVGLHLTTSYTFTAVPATGCTKTPLAKVSVKGASPVVIK